MKWKKITETEDLISYEKEAKEISVRIEARLNKNKHWEIYKIYSYNQNNYIDSYNANSKLDAKNIVSQLLQEKDISIRELRWIQSVKNSRINLRVNRDFKEPGVERWNLVMGNNEIGLATVIFGDYINVDVIVHEKFKFFENNIIEELYRILGIHKNEAVYNIFYYTKRSEGKPPEEKNRTFIGRIEMGFMPSNQ